MNQLDRRTFLGAFALTAALAGVTGSGALASTPRSLDRWAQDLADLNRELAAGRLTLTDWQTRVAALNAGVELGELRRYLDFDRLTAAMKFPSRLAETADPVLPTHINVDGIARPWFIRFFGLRRGGAVIPHVHNNMVSAHLVVDGQFQARTFDRLADLVPLHPRPSAVPAIWRYDELRPMLMESGALITAHEAERRSAALVLILPRSRT